MSTTLNDLTVYTNINLRLGYVKLCSVNYIVGSYVLIACLVVQKRVQNCKLKNILVTGTYVMFVFYFLFTGHFELLIVLIS